MNFFRKIFIEFQARPILASILIANFVSILLFLLLNIMIRIPGDLDIFFGSLLGILYFLKMRRKEKDPLIGGIIVGSISALLSTVSFTIIAILSDPPDGRFIQKVILLFFVGQSIGLLLGGGLGWYYSKREGRNLN